MPPEDEQQVATDTTVEDAPSAEEVTEPTETPDPSPSDVDSPSIDTLIAERGEELLSSEAVKELISKEVEKAQDSARNKLLAEQRRNFTQPEIVQDALLGIVSDAGLDPANISRSMRDKANTLYSTAATAAVELVNEELPGAVLPEYDFDKETMAKYAEHQRSGQTLDAWKTLIEAAVATQIPSEEEIARRVKVGIDEGMKAEQETASTNGVTPPATTKAGPTTSQPYQLTTAEIGVMPASVWRSLPADVKTAIKANVTDADRERGESDIDMSRLQAIEAARV